MSNDLAGLYRAYIACLNRQDWQRLADFVGDDVRHNGRTLGLAGYRRMLEQDFDDIPDLQFKIDMLLCDGDRVAARLAFDCRPKGRFLGIDIDGRRVSFTEHVFYAFEHRRIAQVWSVIDKAAIEAQL